MPIPPIPLQSLLRSILATALLALAPALPAAVGTAAPLPAREAEAGAPFLRNFTTKDYGAGSQNWGMLQDRRGVLYVANGAGILEHEGAHWRLIPTPRHTTIRALAEDGQGRIFAGGQGEFGVLAPDAAGRMQYTALESLLEPGHKAFSDVWKVFRAPEGIWFQAREGLFLYAGGRIRVWTPSTGFHLAFQVGTRLFVRQFDVGLLEMKEGRLVPVPGGERFATERVYVMLPWGRGTVLVGTRSSGFFLLSGDALRPVEYEADAYLRGRSLYHGVLQPDGDALLSTMTGGIVRMDRAGRICGILDRDSGIQSNTVYCAHPDGSGVWLGLDNGITHVEWPSPLSVLDDRSGLKGRVTAICRHQGRLYAGTLQGVFVLEGAAREGRAAFRQVKGPTFQTTRFASMGDVLLSANQQGIFEIRDGRSRMILGVSTGATVLLASRTLPGRVFVGLQDGLSTLRRTPGRGNGWTDEGKVPGLKGTVLSIEEAGDGRLWVALDHEGFARVALPPRWGDRTAEAPVIERHAAPGSYPMSFSDRVFLLGDRPLFSTPAGLSTLDAGGAFRQEPVFAALFGGERRYLKFLAHGAGGSLWMDARTASAYEVGIARPLPGGGYRWQHDPFGRFSEMTVDCALAEEDGIAWFGGTSGLIRYDPALPCQVKPSYPPVIHRVERPGEKIAPSPSPGLPALPYDPRALRFEFGLPFFDQGDANRFQILLEGHDREWSEWTDETAKEYTNLREGEYRLRVRARNVHGATSGEGGLAFRILPPWHRTWTFRSLEFLGLAGGLVLLVGWRQRHLRARNVHLEAQVVLRTEALQEANSSLLERDRQNTELIGQLQSALSEVRTLQGLIPICCYCKKIRDDTGYWNQLELYLQARSGARFSHGICPECNARVRAEYEREGLLPRGKGPA